MKRIEKAIPDEGMLNKYITLSLNNSTEVEPIADCLFIECKECPFQLKSVNCAIVILNTTARIVTNREEEDDDEH